MLTTDIAKAAVPTLGWTGSGPGLLAILAKALRKPAHKPESVRETRRFA